MSQELTIPKDERPIVMRSGLVHWVSTATAEKIQGVLAAQVGHSFINVTERGITLNTADVEGVYTMQQYEDLAKVKQGMWQCEYKNWHNKGKKECECKKEAWDRARKARQDAEKKESERDLTPEERQCNLETMRKMGEEMRAKFGWGSTSKILAAGDRTCIMCPTKLTGNLRHYCSGVCVVKARERGIYGHEAEQRERAEALATLD